MNAKPERCSYCGTICEKRDGELYQDDGERLHVSSICREYVFAALGSYKRELTALRAQVDELCDALTPEDVSRIKWKGFHLLLKLNGERRTTSASPTGEKP